MAAGSVIRYDGARGVVWRIKYTDAANVQQMETLGRAADGWTERKAGAALEKRLEAVAKGWRKPTAVMFADYAERWFRAGPKMRGWKPGTVKIYVFAERRLVEAFGTMALDAIRPSHVAEFIAAHPNGASSVRRDHACLHAILASARKEELIDRNPAENAELPAMPRNRWRLVKPEEVPVIAAAFTDARARRVFLTLIGTGLRRFEVQGLRWRDVSLVERTLRVEVSKSEEGERVLAIPPRLADELAAQFQESPFKSDDDYVFAHPELGNAADFSQWYPREWRKALKAAGISDYIRPCHDMRHTALTNLAAVGAGGPKIMAIAGHRSYATTKRYIDLAGVTFPDEMEALEQRMQGARTTTSRAEDAELSTEPSTRLGESQPIR
jgi:integrase